MATNFCAWLKIGNLAILQLFHHRKEITTYICLYYHYGEVLAVLVQSLCDERLRRLQSSFHPLSF